MRVSEIPIWNAIVEDGYVICTVEIEPGVFRLRRVPPDFVGATGAQGPVGPAGSTGPAGLQGDPGPQGIQGIPGNNGTNGTNGTNGIDGISTGLNYVYSGTTSSGDPGAGVLRFNNADLALATALFISETDDDTNNLGAYLATLDDSTSTIRGFLSVRKKTDPAVFSIFSISGVITDNGTWDTFTVTNIVKSGTLVQPDEIVIDFIPKGDKGDTGAAGPPGAGGTVDDWLFFAERSQNFFNGGITLIGDAWASTASSVNAVAADANNPQGRDLRTSATTNNSAFYESPTTSFRLFSLNNKTVMWIKLNETTNTRSWLGYTNATGANLFLQTEVMTVVFVGFRFSTSLPDTNWQAVVCDGTSQTVVDTGVAPSTTVGQLFRIEWNRGGGEIRFYIGSALVATIITTLPTADTAMRHVYGVKNIASAARTMNTFSVKIREGSVTPA